MTGGPKASAPEVLVSNLTQCGGLTLDKFGNLFFAADDTISMISATQLDLHETAASPIVKYTAQ